jgi:hypothetical protein
MIIHLLGQAPDGWVATPAEGRRRRIRREREVKIGDFSLHAYSGL